MKNTIICSIHAFSEDFGKLLLRLVLAVAIIPHGLQNVVGIFGGNGLSATWDYFTQILGIAPFWAGLAVFVEFVVPVLLILGIFTRICAGMLAVFMAVAMQYHWDYGYFLNWSGVQVGEGVEFHVLFIGTAIAILLIGGGKFAFFEGCMCRRRCSPPPQNTLKEEIY